MTKFWSAQVLLLMNPDRLEARHSGVRKLCLRQKQSFWIPKLKEAIRSGKTERFICHSEHR